MSFYVFNACMYRMFGQLTDICLTVTKILNKVLFIYLSIYARLDSYKGPRKLGSF